MYFEGSRINPDALQYHNHGAGTLIVAITFVWYILVDSKVIQSGCQSMSMIGSNSHPNTMSSRSLGPLKWKLYETMESIWIPSKNGVFFFHEFWSLVKHIHRNVITHLDSLDGFTWRIPLNSRSPAGVWPPARWGTPSPSDKMEVGAIAEIL